MVYSFSIVKILNSKKKKKTDLPTLFLSACYANITFFGHQFELWPNADYQTSKACEQNDVGPGWWGLGATPLQGPGGGKHGVHDRKQNVEESNRKQSKNIAIVHCF